MENENLLRDYGLFDAKVPRYTSYPPANRFAPDVGAAVQKDWLQRIPAEEPVSVYIHIPFCRRLCWFCACRTQGTKTMQPVEAYLDDLITEIELVTANLSGTQQMARLHLGGGTPTLLNADQLTRLLDAVDRHFTKTNDFEFSVEIDPTEAARGTLDTLAARGMNRASIGVQDFAPKVQAAIGRQQSYAQTRAVVDHLRRRGVQRLNIDLLYGLPFQTPETLLRTLQQVHTLRPSRLALYGYAHVPHMSKRQKLIPHDKLPSSVERYQAAVLAKSQLQDLGYVAIGIDHFALKTDSLAHAAATGTLRRNFQGYTDDPCTTLIGLGASAISRYKEGYIQNAVATPDYQRHLREGRLPGQKGYVLSSEDAFLADVVEQMMCQGEVDANSLVKAHAHHASDIPRLLRELKMAFPEALRYAGTSLYVKPGMEPLTRLIAARVDTALRNDHVHSAAI